MAMGRILAEPPGDGLATKYCLGDLESGVPLNRPDGADADCARLHWPGGTSTLLGITSAIAVGIAVGVPGHAHEGELIIRLKPGLGAVAVKLEAADRLPAQCGGAP